MQITKDNLIVLREESASDMAEKLQFRARELARSSRVWYYEVGLICAEVEDRELWRRMLSNIGDAYGSWSAWVIDTFGESKSSAFEAARIIRLCKDDIPEAELRRIPRMNLKHVAECSDAVKRDPKIWEAARVKSEDEFVSTLNISHYQHIERKSFFHIAPIGEQKVTLAAVVEAVRIIEDVPEASPTDCIVKACEYYLEMNQESDAIKKAREINAMAQRTEAIQ